MNLEISHLKLEAETNTEMVQTGGFLDGTGYRRKFPVEHPPSTQGSCRVRMPEDSLAGASGLKLRVTFDCWVTGVGWSQPVGEVVKPGAAWKEFERVGDPICELQLGGIDGATAEVLPDKLGAKT